MHCEMKKRGLLYDTVSSYDLQAFNHVNAHISTHSHVYILYINPSRILERQGGKRHTPAGGLMHSTWVGVGWVEVDRILYPPRSALAQPRIFSITAHYNIYRTTLRIERHGG